MKLPGAILRYLKFKKILSPTPIQIQGISTAYVILLLTCYSDFLDSQVEI